MYIHVYHYHPCKTTELAPFILMPGIDAVRGLIAEWRVGWHWGWTFVVGFDTSPSISTKRSCKMIIDGIRLSDAVGTWTVPGGSEGLAEVVVNCSNHYNISHTDTTTTQHTATTTTTCWSLQHTTHTNQCNMTWLMSRNSNNSCLVFWLSSNAQIPSPWVTWSAIRFWAKKLQWTFLDPEGGSQKATLVVVLVVISSLKIPKAFLIRSGAQRNFAHTFVLTLLTDLPSQIFLLFSN